jgi:nitrogen fixation/metabolism regulation signal transduction histidine kinase
MTKNISSFLQGLSQASLSRKILIAIVTIVLILSSVSLLFIDQGVRRQVEKNILTQLDSAATAYIELNDARLEQVLARTQFFIQSPTFQRDMRGAPATSAKVSAGFKKVTDFDFLMVVSFTGRVLIDSVHPDLAGKAVPSDYQDLLQKTVENGRYLGMWSENEKTLPARRSAASGFRRCLAGGQCRQRQVCLQNRRIEPQPDYLL